MKNRKHTVVGIGEILWDMLPGGKKLGGAPANFAYHAGELGAEAYIISSVGNDKPGNEIIETLNSLGVSSRYIQVDKNHPTGSVEVKLKADGIPSYIIHKNVAWDYIYLDKACLELAQKADAICFGSLSQRSEISGNTILEILSNTKGQCIKVFDINIRQNFYNKEIICNSLKYADVLKLNEEELPIILNLLEIEDSQAISSTKEILQRLAEEYSMKLIALTRGEKGSFLLSGNESSNHSGFQVKVVDTVGAGDAFTAAVVVGLLNKMDLGSINDFANRVGSYVCTQEGGTPPNISKFAVYNL